MNRGIVARGVLVATGLAVLAAVAACGGSPTASPTAGPISSQPPTTPALTPVPSPTGAPTPLATHGKAARRTTQPTQPTQATQATSAPKCAYADYDVNLGSVSGALGHDSQVIQFTNDTSTPCVIGGFPTVFFAGGPDGPDIGPQAQPVGPTRAAVTLAPGKVASAVLTYLDAENFDASRCNPEKAAGFLVNNVFFVDNLTDGSYQACQSPGQQLLVYGIKPGPGDVTQP